MSYNREAVYRARICCVCRTQERQARQREAEADQKRADFVGPLPEICETSPADQLLSLVDQVSDECGFADFGELAAYWAGIVSDPKTARGVRVTALRALAHISEIAEAEAAETDEDRHSRIEPTAYLQWLSDRGLLPGLLRAALADGLITLDQIDPPGSPGLSGA